MSRGDSQRSRFVVLFVAMLAAVLLSALAATAADASGGSISGTVTDAVSEEAVEGIVVCALPVVTGSCDDTDSAGEYETASLPAGEYRVEFAIGLSSSDYLSQYYDEAESYESAQPLTVESEPVTGVDAALVRAAHITGIVTAAASGAPVPGAVVCALDPATGVPVTFCTEAAAGGSYAIGGLRSGEYTVEFEAGSSGQPLLTQFYDHKPSLAEADAIELETGETRTGIDAALEAEPAPPPAAGSVPPILSTPPPLLSSPPTPPVVHRRGCRKGLRKRRVNGKLRCVKVRKHRHRHRRHHHHPASGRAAQR